MLSSVLDYCTVLSVWMLSKCTGQLHCAECVDAVKCTGQLHCAECVDAVKCTGQLHCAECVDAVKCTGLLHCAECVGCLTLMLELLSYVN